jgi:hypothetical protein
MVFNACTGEKKVKRENSDEGLTDVRGTHTFTPFLVALRVVLRLR